MSCIHQSSIGYSTVSKYTFRGLRRETEQAAGGLGRLGECGRLMTLCVIGTFIHLKQKIYHHMVLKICSIWRTNISGRFEEGPEPISRPDGYY